MVAESREEIAAKQPDQSAPVSEAEPVRGLNLVDIAGSGSSYRPDRMTSPGDAALATYPAVSALDKSKPLSPGDHRETFKIDGMDRQFEVHMPAGYDGHSRLPVVYMLHGLTENMDMMKEYSHMNKVADKDGFAVVYLQALKQPMPGTLGLYDETSWNLDHGTLTPKDPRYDDLDYFKAVKNQVESQLSVDSKRQFLAGFSEGGEAAQYISHEMPGVFAGIAAVHSTLLKSDPRPDKNDPTAVMVVLGNDDNILPLKGGHGFGEGGWPLKGYETLLVPKVGQSEPLAQAPAWAAADSDNQVSQTKTPLQDITIYSGGAEPVKEVVRKSHCSFIVFDCSGGQHAWDGGDGGWQYAQKDLIERLSRPVRNPDPTYDTSSEIWDFFRDKSRP